MMKTKGDETKAGIMASKGRERETDITTVQINE